MFNIRIDLMMNPVSFGIKERRRKKLDYWDDYYDHRYNSNEIQRAIDFGRVADFANSHISGAHYVTEKGFLLPEYGTERKEWIREANFPHKVAKLDISKNEIGLRDLEKELNGYSFCNHLQQVELSSEDGEIHYLKADGKQIYLPTVREKLVLKVA